MINKVFLVSDSIIYNNNEIFNLNSKYNRDNAWYPYYLLKKEFSKHNIELLTYDLLTKNESNYILIYIDAPPLESIKKHQDIKKYLMLFESALIKPNNWEIEIHQYFDKIFTWKDDIIDNKKYFKINFSHLFPSKINKDLSKKEKLCTLIAGNKRVNHPLELYSKRVESIRWFETNYPNDFDFYGIGWDEFTPRNKYIRFAFRKSKLSKLIKPNFPSYRGKVDSKKEVLEKYKFTICYENARDIDGYITEKIFDCFFTGCIPIYLGANNITDHIPKECFIDKKEFDCYEKLYEFITSISDKEYLKYLDTIENYLNSSKADEFRAEYFANTIVETILNDIK